MSRSPERVDTGRVRAGRVLAPLLGLAGLVAVLEVLPHTGLVSPRDLPPATSIGRALLRMGGDAAFWAAVGDTLTGWALGLGIAVVAGVVVGVVIGSVGPLRALTASTIEFLRPIPSVALIPLAVLLYGTDLRSTLLLVASPPAEAVTAGGVVGDRWGRVRYVLWPTALPYVMTGVRLAASVALVLAITAELVIGGPGLGNQIAVAQTSGAVPQVYALVVVTGLLGVAINTVARLVERRVLAWHPSVRAEVAR